MMELVSLRKATLCSKISCFGESTAIDDLGESRVPRLDGFKGEFLKKKKKKKNREHH